MGEKIIYLGPFNNDKGEQLFKKALNYARENKGDRLYYILPNGELLHRYRRRLIQEVKNTFHINLFTFDNIVDGLLKDTYTYIDKELKGVLISKILDRLKSEDRLKYYRAISSKKGFIKVLIDIIGELKRSLITPGNYMLRSPDIPFYKEIGIIYEEYKKQLDKNGLMDREGSFLEAISLLREDNSYFEDLDLIIIDQFFDFRPQEMGLLKEMVDIGVPIYINMPFNRKKNLETLVATIEELKDLGFKVVSIEEREYTYFERMANTIFSHNADKLAPNSNISIIKAPNSYLELKKIGEKIKQHYAKGIDIKDMAIVLANPDEYKDIMFEVFKKEGIPCSLDKDIRLIDVPFIRELLYILKLKQNRMSKSSVINRIKCSYFRICNGKDGDLVEYTLRKLDFDSISKLKDSGKLENLNNIKAIEDIIGILEGEIQILPQKANIKDYTDFLMQIIEKYDLSESILKKYEHVQDYDLLHRDFVALDKLIELLEKLSRFKDIFKAKIGLGEFIDLLEGYLENQTVTETPRNDNGVSILTPVTARGHKFEILFVAGLSQGKYPNLQDENFFFREGNHKELKGIGLNVKNYYEKLDKESLIFAIIISACANKLYLSYSENATGDEKDIPSIFLDEVLKVLEGKSLGKKLNIVDVNMDYLFKDDVGQLTMEKDIFNRVSNNILCEVEREKDEFNKYNGNIGDEHIRRDIADIHKDKIYSISYLESYGICPYYFLLNNILDVKEMERAPLDFTPLDRGIIFHDILKQYYFKYMDQIRNHVLDKKEFEIEETYNYIVDRLEQAMQDRGLGDGSRLWRIRIENNADIIFNFVKSDLERLSGLKNKVIPVEFEVEFGRDRTFEIELGDFKVPFTGTIDRIDKYIDEDKYILIDYKSSTYGDRKIDDMRAGISLQLPIYILSQRNKNVVAGMYGIISNGKFVARLGNVEEKHLMTRANRGALTKEELEGLLDDVKDIIASYLASIYKGDFSVNPRECSPYCIYKDICRYEKRLEVK